jgi:Flp pilus assembly protein TadD
VNPEDAHARNALAVALAAIKDYAGAKTQLQHARAIDPGNPLYERNWNCLERNLGDCELDF